MRSSALTVPRRRAPRVLPRWMPANWGIRRQTCGRLLGSRAGRKRRSVGDPGRGQGPEGLLPFRWAEAQSPEGGRRLTCPPGQHPSRISPVANAGLRFISLAMVNARTGRIEYWHTKPRKIGPGRAAHCSQQQRRCVGRSVKPPRGRRQRGGGVHDTEVQPASQVPHPPAPLCLTHPSAPHCLPFGRHRWSG